MVLDREDATRVVMRSTFGLLVSRASGRDMRWVCEDAAFFGPANYDPPIAIAPGGVILGALATGLSRGTNGGCSWERAPAFEGLYVVDVSVDARGRAIVVGQTDTRGFFGWSTDSGATWQRVDLPEDVTPLTVDAAPSRPDRVYASGRAAFPQFGAMARSDDGGATWTKSFFDLHGGREPYIAGVDPRNPDRVVLRVFADTEERLVVSDDAGLTFHDVLTTPSFLFGLALSPDGSRAAVGTPTEGLRVGAGDFAGLVKLSSIDSRCLAWTPGGDLYACATEPKDGFTLALFTGAAGAPDVRYRLADTLPLACAPDTRAGAICPAKWPDVQKLLQSISADAGPDAAAEDAGSAVIGPGKAPEIPKKLGIRGGGCGASRWETTDKFAITLIIFALGAVACTRGPKAGMRAPLRAQSCLRAGRGVLKRLLCRRPTPRDSHQSRRGPSS